MFSLLGKKNKAGFNNILWEAGVSFLCLFGQQGRRWCWVGRRGWAGPEAETVKPRGRRRGGWEGNTRCLIEELVSQQLMGCFCRELQGNLSWVGFLVEMSIAGDGAGWSEACGELSPSENAPKRAGVSLIYGDMVFHADTVMVNEGGLSCFLLKSGRLEDSWKNRWCFLEDCSQHPQRFIIQMQIVETFSLPVSSGSLCHEATISQSVNGAKHQWCNQCRED